MFLLHKTKLNHELEYVRFDDWDIKHHIMNRLGWNWYYSNEEWDWVYDLKDLLPYIVVAMDDDTEILIVPAKEVKWVPSAFKNWYFYY